MSGTASRFSTASPSRGPLGKATAFLPPAIATGESRQIRLDFPWAQSVTSRDRLDVTVAYHGVDGTDARLTFSAQYFHPGRRRIENVVQTTETMETANGEA